MSGISLHAEIEDRSIRAKLTALIALGRNPADAMRDIATYGQDSTRERFRLQIGPDGNRWKPSLRVQLQGGKTLTRDGHMASSLTSRSGSNFAEWGTNRIYAAIHQLGGNAGRGLRSKIVSRPYLGVNNEDASEILNILRARIEGTHYKLGDV